MSPFFSLFAALFITLVIEVPLGVLMLKRKDTIIPLILINVLTNPALNAALMILFSLTQSYSVYLTAVVIGEISVFVGESFFIRSLCNLPLKRSFILSISINSASLLLGSAIIPLIQGGL